MSFKIVKSLAIPQDTSSVLPLEEPSEGEEDNVHIGLEDLPVQGQIFSDLKHIYLIKESYLEVRTVDTGRKIGSWKFGRILKDQNTRITAVEELKRDHGMLSFLLVAFYCPLSGSILCVFDCFGSKILRAVAIEGQITKLHVVNPGCQASVIPESSPLKYFDGIVAIGFLGGDVLLLDIFKELCEHAVQNLDDSLRDEINPSKIAILKKNKLGNIKKYITRAVTNDEHLGIHLNVVEYAFTKHFTLKGTDGEDRVHVNRSEVEVSALFYSPQIASLLVAYNFGAFQMWDLRTLDLCYTSPICEGNIPITHFNVQEPADDPKAYCYIWVSFSHNLLHNSGLPFAVMYSFYFNNKIPVPGYGNLYEEFQHCSIRFQVELGDTQCKSPVKGGICLGFQSINKCPSIKDHSSLALCLVSWLVWDEDREITTSVLLFDLNQWYKEQMPRVPSWSHCSNYMIKNSISGHLFDIKLDKKSLRQFMGIQRLEEHFCPTSLTFDLWGLTSENIIKIHNKGVQKDFLDKIIASQHLALVRPESYSERVVTLGLVPLFFDIQPNHNLDVDYEREILLNVVLEQKLVGWLCQAASKLVNDSFKASGLSIYNILNWALQRAVELKNALYNYCIPLFDHSGVRLDENTLALISNGNNQISNLCSVYKFISAKLSKFVSDPDELLEQQKSLENLVVYFEVVLWMSNVGLLPEGHSHGQVDSLVNAPYSVNELTQYYNKKRAQLQLSSGGTFAEKDCLLFIDNMINNMVGGDTLRQQWQEDGGSGLYPAPSLQSVLRTYLIDGPSLSDKHSLVAYTLLDINASVDEHKITKLLLKFPQIFALSLSKTKILQAFWLLDHDHYETALETILDPCVLLEDLYQWHHSVMMRSLLMQEQPSLALQYLQVRKPSIQNEKDLLTVISLLISRNMLDEAFKFRLQHKGPNEYALLTHIFNECNKNNTLYSLLYRNLSSDEERAFFKYLHNTKSPRCEDLQIFYHLLRSRFLEAFDAYSSTRRRHPDTQGLIGQREGSTADIVVKMFKNLLPDVNRNIVELVRKERTTLWKELPKPTPFSVFVHNAREKDQYKSSVIFAALSKAKQTFSDTVESNNVVTTENTPFLRIPRAFRNRAALNPSVLKIKVIEQPSEGDLSPPPCKRLKLSSRATTTTPIQPKSPLLSAAKSKLSTPIVKRKHSPERKEDCVPPQSILKLHTILNDSIFNENTSVNTSLQAEYEKSIRKASLGLTPRKSLRTTLKPHVKFDDLRYSGSSTDRSGSHNISQQSKVSVDASEDKFYSPEQSVEQNDHTIDETTQEHSWLKSTSVIKSTSDFVHSQERDDASLLAPHSSVIVDNRKETTNLEVKEQESSGSGASFQSPRARKSYKRSFSEYPTPVRSSPRLARKSTEPSRGRKSLSRVVLEQNAYSAFRENPNTGAPERSEVPSLGHSFSESDSTDVSSISLVSVSPVEPIGFSYFSNSNVNLDSRTTEITKKQLVEDTVTDRNTGDIILSRFTKGSSRLQRTELFKDEGNQISEKSNSSLLIRDIKYDTISDDDNGRNSQRDTVERPHSRKTSKGSSEDEDCVRLSDRGKDADAENINIYEDLSSGSEDVKQVREQVNAGDVAVNYSEGFLNSGSQEDDGNECVVLVDSFDDDGCNIETTQNVETHKIAASDQDVIEINSSSDDNSDKCDDKSHYTGETSTRSSASSTPSNGSSGSSESVEGLNDDNYNNPLNRAFNMESIRDSDSDVSGRDLASPDNRHFVTSSCHRQIEVDKPAESVSNLEEGDPDFLQYDNEMDVSMLEVEEIVQAHEVRNEDDCKDGGADEILNEPETEKHEQLSSCNNKTEMRSVALQCTLKPSDDSPNVPLVLRTVKKTYKGTKNLSSDPTAKTNIQTTSHSPLEVDDQITAETRAPHSTSSAIDLDATPKVAVALTGRTYTRKVPNISSHLKLATEEIKPEGAPNVVEENVEEKFTEPTLKEDSNIDFDATLKVAVALTRRTYTRKVPNISSHLELATEEIKPEGAPNVVEENVEEKITKPTLKEDSNIDFDATPRLARALTRRTYARGVSTCPSDLEKNIPVKDVNAVKTREEEIGREQIGPTREAPSVQNEGVRMTRRRRALSSQESEVDNVSSQSTESGKTNRRRSMSTSAVDDETSRSKTAKKTAQGHRTRKLFSDLGTFFEDTVNRPVPEDANEKTDQKSDTDVGPLMIYSKRLTKTQKKTTVGRRNSMDQQPISGTKRITRSKSINLDDLSLGVTSQEPVLHVIRETDNEPIASTSKEVPTRTTKGKSRALSHLGDYTTTRRLTRRQASILETISSSVDAEHLPVLEEIDPLHLLDKAEFKGNPDPEERKVYESSPSSSGTSRKTRSASVVSDILPSTPTKEKTRGGSSVAKQPTPGIKSRLRRPSADTLSVVSDQSTSPSPPKRTKRRASQSEDSPPAVRTQRGRSSTKSITSDKSDGSSRTVRTRRLPSTKSDLPEIEEEKVIDEDSKRGAIKKRSRK